ncbi:hypothetical protein GUJ93_ZPchr0001g31140 [Zizania palustris]|uniref:Epidermal patterning factor-like protein n=1 Tax=Zizania palustris TaxID=103762 RepID=A0A8J5R5G5_ZIZPA|nr:hypothetical protein GUJ93_ZPchr0001g31140 [Zizania palustris]
MPSRTQVYVSSLHRKLSRCKAAACMEEWWKEKKLAEGSVLQGMAGEGTDFGRMAVAEAHSDDMPEEGGQHVRRRLLSGGLGSHPPRCTSKCGSCSPCSPVHVSVPPGVLVTTEYYPEAWRCKCRNQLYMP